MAGNNGDAPDSLSGRHIIVGVSGGIAAYKAPLLVRRLKEAGAEVQVVMTENAARFVTSTTLQAVSGLPVRTSLWDEAAEAAMGHIELARWADLILIAPVTADTLGRLASGRANDLLCTLRLASRAPVLLAPAMNQVMWEHPATQRNLELLRLDGCSITGPASGPQACGEYGPGRMVEPDAIFQAAKALLAAASELPGEKPQGKLSGRRVVITAGPTREAIDPVRYISNHSSGKQGYALATAAKAAGADVILVSGPVALAAPAGVKRILVTSARQMQEAVEAQLPGADIFIGVAAVADYRPAEAKEQKIKKTATDIAGMTLALVENPDIISGVSQRLDRPFVVGFAAETEHALSHARDKRVRKGMDMIVVNDVSDAAIGFNSDENAVTVIWDGGEEQLPRSGKDRLATMIVDRIAACFIDRPTLATRGTAPK